MRTMADAALGLFHGLPDRMQVIACRDDGKEHHQGRPQRANDDK